MFDKFLRFVAVGAVATGIHYLLLVIGVELLGVEVVIASTIGYVVSAGVNYALNYRFTFGSPAIAHSRGALRFATVVAAGLALNWGIMSMLTGAGIQYLVAQLLTTGAVLVWNFAGSALWTFAQPAK